MTAPVSELAPVSAPERVAALDALRGLALLGILLSNVASFAGPLYELHAGIDPALRGSDRAIAAFVYVAIRDKAWSLFALLFGMGFAAMLGRARAAGRGFGAVYLRRTLGLAAIGLVHAWAIWAGDILVTYALCAFALLALRRLSEETWLALGCTLYAAGIGFMLLVAASLSLPGVPRGGAKELAQAQAERAAEIAAYAQGDYAAATAQRLHFFFDTTLPGWVVMLPLALGLFLIGAALMRSGALADPHRHRAELQAGARWPLRFAAVGRMALTHYLTQSLVATWLLYGHGLGQWGRWSYTALAIAALALFAAQMAFSAWWLRRFRFGPVEWLWRAFTYRRWPPLRIERGHAQRL